MSNTPTNDENVTDFFWSVAEPMLDDENVTQSTMMGFPCLRVDGDFYASADHRSGDLVIKLPAHRVLELIDQGIGKEFAPNGRRFKEWVAVEEHDASLWESLILEAKSFVGGI